MNLADRNGQVVVFTQQNRLPILGVKNALIGYDFDRFTFDRKKLLQPLLYPGQQILTLGRFLKLYKC